MSDVEELCVVDVSELVAWITAISFEDWPQQARVNGKLRPAMMPCGEQADAVVRHVMAMFPGCTDYNRLLSVVMPGHSIEPHRDPQTPQWRTRVHVPLTSNDQSRFISSGIAHRMLPGFAYRVDTQAEHAVENNGITSRIHLMFDVGNP